ncbi:hypothetical protein ACVNS2_09695 [Paenibacillus caseinilyticus]|uniref:VCBS repeat-containing protein n=1 Tax=Paenibacillus mucilaginosus K02 TaxID=997761 RepID=I0BEX2_9BACL|nr:hypothetical protein [Paenibacillus mucilaginosus]AFH60919.1 hypothetical protein B2K_09325 [Paenibacillus mucilaginosus K02]
MGDYLTKGLLLLALLGCTGCSLIGQPGAYMRLPKLPAEQETLKSVIEAALPPGAALVRPSHAVQAGAISVVDLDGDGSEEAVFYYKIKESEQLHGEIWSQSDGAWKRSDSFEGAGYELDELRFERITLDDTARGVNVVAAYATSEDAPKGLAVYAVEHGRAVKKFELPYTDYVIDDLNGNDRQDLTVILHDREKRTSAAALYEYENGLRKISTLTLDGTVEGYYSMISGRVTPELRGVVLDAAVGAHSSYTEMLIYRDGRLRRAFDPKLTSKAYTAQSEDADRDGILDVVGMEAPPGWEKQPIALIPWIYTYSRWDGSGGFQRVLQRYWSGQDGYYFDFPAEWPPETTLEVEEGTAVRFIAAPGSTVRLAEIRMFPIEAWNEEQTDWLPVHRTADKVLAINREAEEYRSLLHLLSEMKSEGSAPAWAES